MLAASLTLSYCEGGNIPGGENLTFAGDGLTVRNLAASGGAGQETAAQAQARLLRELNTTRKCVSAGDYERLARETPGLRVAAAKALPAFDPEEPTGVSRLPTVTVVAVPAGAGERPLPDRRFLAAVQAWLDWLRPIGTRVKVIPPVYVELTVRSLRGARTEELTLERCAPSRRAAASAASSGRGISPPWSRRPRCAPGAEGGPAHHRAGLLSERGRGHPSAPPGHPAAEGAPGGAPAGGADRPLI